MLVAVGRTARHRRDAQALRRVQPGELIVHLLGQLARRHDHERARPRHVRRLDGFTRHGSPQRETDGQRLARARLRADAQIASFVRGIQHRLLHRRERRVAFLG